MVRTRIAPSPTGFPHVGTIYQSLFDFAYAKKNNGEFIVRIEDTDRKRFVEGAEEVIYKALDWFSLHEDESPRKGGPRGPYKSSERIEIYKKHAKELVTQGNAYYCFCTPERLDEIRKRMQQQGKPTIYDKHCRNITLEKAEERVKEVDKFVIRLKVPQNQTITIRDGIRGEINFDSNLIDDQVLLKSDGFPTYHLAVVVDDHLMKITHVIRAEEWLSSTPKHVLLYDYFGWKKPFFFHTADLRTPEKAKISKRHGHADVRWYQNEGFLPEAILNYLAHLGWSHPEEKEIFDLNEFIELFDIKDIKPVGPVFDVQKLEWMNGMYIRQSQNSNLKTQIYDFYKKKYSEEVIEKTIPLIKERIKKLSDYLPLCEFFFKEPETYEAELSSKRKIFEETSKCLSGANEWRADILGEMMQKAAKELDIKNSEYFMLIRVAITGKKVSPPLNESMEVLGKEKVIERLKKAVL